MPERIQRKRTKGWRIPEGTVYVGRPSKWGNPFVVGRYVFHINRQVRNADDAVALFRERSNWFMRGISHLPTVAARELRGKDLACWCALDQPCHADVLLEWANAGADQ